MRVDGSSTFPAGKQYGFFPSFSAGWRISEEPWFKNKVTSVDDLKLRASYGTLGNDNVGQFQYYNNYSFNNSYVIGADVIHSGIDLTKLANPNITWEVAKKLDIGLNATSSKSYLLKLLISNKIVLTFLRLVMLLFQMFRVSLTLMVQVL
jgi:hypothetical protein